MHLPISNPVAAAVVAAVLLAGASQTASAQSPYAYPWCAKYTSRVDATSCYFTSYRQCEATVSGIGGYCYQSQYFRPGFGSASRRWRQ